MDMQTLDLSAFVEALTEDELDVCERDEAALGEIFKEGWSEANAVRFHRAMFAARRANPKATVEGVFEMAMANGLSFVIDALKAPVTKQAPGLKHGRKPKLGLR